MLFGSKVMVYAGVLQIVWEQRTIELGVRGTWRTGRKPIEKFRGFEERIG